MYHRSIFSDEQHRNSFEEFNVPLLEDDILQEKEDSDDEDEDNYDREKQRPIPSSVFSQDEIFALKFYLCQLPPPLFSPHQARKKNKEE